MNRFFNAKIFIIILIANLLSVLAIFPYLFSVQSEIFQNLPFSPVVLVILQLSQSFVLFSFAIAIGLIASKRVGFDTPLLHAILNKDYSRIKLLQHVLLPIAFGIGVSVVIFLLDLLFAVPELSISGQPEDIALWKRIFACFYGGIVEETLLRLFLMSVIIWITVKSMKISKTPAFVIWVGICVSAVIFGVAHLPITSQLVELSTLIIIRGIILNGIGGVVFGYLFWKKGLEASIFSHFAADFMILVVLPFLF